MEPLAIARALVRDLKPLQFAAPVSYVYNPLDYAFAAHRQYIERYGAGRKQVVMLGMNPGPWGMAQTGVPFGEVNIVRDWLKIDAAIKKPAHQHPKRPILGLGCTRSEVSGARLWGWARDAFGTPKKFFKRFYITNYCPLSFMEEGGRNRTPDKLPAPERTALFEHCDRALRRQVEFYRPKLVIGIGAFAEKRARAALDGLDVTIGRVLHPSPASPIANRGWAERAERDLAGLGIEI